GERHQPKQHSAHGLVRRLPPQGPGRPHLPGLAARRGWRARRRGPGVRDRARHDPVRDERGLAPLHHLPPRQPGSGEAVLTGALTRKTRPERLLLGAGKMRRSPGYTLVEILIAIVILAIGIVGALALLVATLQTAGAGVESSVASTVAQS